MSLQTSTKQLLCMQLQGAAKKNATDVKDKDWKRYKVVNPIGFGVMSTFANMDEVIA